MIEFDSLQYSPIPSILKCNFNFVNFEMQVLFTYQLSFVYHIAFCLLELKFVLTIINYFKSILLNYFSFCGCVEKFQAVFNKQAIYYMPKMASTFWLNFWTKIILTECENSKSQRINSFLTKPKITSVIFPFSGVSFWYTIGKYLASLTFTETEIKLIGCFTIYKKSRNFGWDFPLEKILCCIMFLQNLARKRPEGLWNWWKIRKTLNVTSKSSGSI